MTAIPRLRRQCEVALLAALVVALALAVVVGCPGPQGSDSDTEYSLTISSTAGGSVTAPGEGSFTYKAGTVAQLVATPDEGYEFRGWTGDTGQIANRNSSSTTIRMNGNYSVTATFGQQGASPGPTPRPPVSP